MYLYKFISEDVKNVLMLSLCVLRVMRKCHLGKMLFSYT
jgi:hypothetical protein